MIANIEFNVLKVMAEKDWNCYLLVRVLSVRDIPGFGNVVRIVNSLTDQGLVEIIDIENATQPDYRVTDEGHEYVKNHHSGD
ncbi:MarR family transcriptional regulator [Citrobacter portucalensis]|uniref:MarR family transcriptional regulator n=1 Tax=Citrobacter portucalensis TaxID=1639133 RepID=UPI00202CA804|nr:MarR family transcriptional regulator [Citrobacter portucalensis]URR12502.1 MarR family transcriptional regulator [Citrobacter portucalensis]